MGERGECAMPGRHDGAGEEVDELVQLAGVVAPTR